VNAPKEASQPKLLQGQVAFLRVVSVTDFGAFYDWGSTKDLLVPRAEAIADVLVDEIHPIGLFIDDMGRPTGTMRISEMLRERRDFEVGEWVLGEAWRHDPRIGTFVIVEKRFVGLIPISEPSRLTRGEATKLRVANVLADGKIELSERGLAHEEVENDARIIAEALALPDKPRVGDHSSPEEIRARFGLSKKAFKRAVGFLLKQRAIEIDREGFLVMKRA